MKKYGLSDILNSNFANKIKHYDQLFKENESRMKHIGKVAKMLDCNSTAKQEIDIIRKLNKLIKRNKFLEKEIEKVNKLKINKNEVIDQEIKRLTKLKGQLK